MDFRLSRTRDVAAAKAFFRKALKTQGRAPLSITLDGYAASNRAVREMPAENMIWNDTKLMSSKYLNNMIEQDHRGIKSRIAPMLNFKIFKHAAVPIAGTIFGMCQTFVRSAIPQQRTTKIPSNGI